MKRVKCIHCGTEVEINISNAIDEEGEVFKCPNCEQKQEWSEEDEWKIARICCHLRKVVTEEALNTYRDWLKSFKERVK